MPPLSAIRIPPRRLFEEELRFQSLIEEARRGMAKHYLLESSLELNETAYLLGYEDPNSFIRAFHKWEGASPGEWRSTHIAAELPRSIHLQKEM
jgi:AraC-like DNA-binding protein